MSRLNAVARAFRIVELLAGRYFDGAANRDLAVALGVSTVNICRDLAHLEALGYARKLDNGRWSLTPKILAWSQNFTTHYQNMQNRMSVAAAAMQLRRILAASGAAWAEKHMEHLMRTYPDGMVPADELDGLAERFLRPSAVVDFDTAAPMRVAGGAA